jgi:hypothetical protein
MLGSDKRGMVLGPYGFKLLDVLILESNKMVEILGSPVFVI